MKTYEQFQKLDNEVIEKAKMSITIKAELDGEIYRSEYDASKAFVLSCADNKNMVQRAGAGKLKDIMQLTVDNLLQMPPEVRSDIVLAILKHDMQ